MAEKTTAPDETTTEAPAKSSGGMMGKIKVALFILLVVVVECVVASTFLSNPADVSDSIIEEGAVTEEEESGSEEEHLEIPLGDFDVTVFQPVSNTTLRINFKLVGSVYDEDKAEVEKLLEDNRHRFNEMVMVTVRSSEITDLTDPALGLLKRKILEKSNRLFGKPVMQAMIFSQFSYFEQ